MSDAKNNPVGRPRKNQEVGTEDFKPVERQDVYLEMPREPESFASLDGEATLQTDEEYFAELAFMEEPVTIHIQQPPTDNPPTTVQCWVNGKGAEHFRNGKWMICGWLPIGMPVTTRRKYVEVLARCRRDHVRTSTDNMDAQPDGGRISRKSSSEIVFSIIEDRNPRGRDWFSRIMMEQ